MDFHALPRRDLQALCKRNGVRANMTNAAMADALAALPAVDGAEEYVKQPPAVHEPAAEEEVVRREKQGSPLPRGRRVTAKTTEVVEPDEGKGKEEEKAEASKEEDEPALGAGRRGPGRRARPAPVVAAPTGKAAVEKASEAVKPDEGKSEEEEKADAKVEANEEEDEPALGAGRRGPGRRARPAPLVAAPTAKAAVKTTSEAVKSDKAKDKEEDQADLKLESNREHDAPAIGLGRRGASRRGRPAPEAAAPAAEPAAKAVAEKKGSPPPRARREPARPDDGLVKGDLKQETNEDTEPVQGAVRRAPGRRGRPAPVVAESTAEPETSAAPAKEEKQGSPVPRARRVTSKPTGPTRTDDCVEEADMKLEKDDVDVPAQVVGRRGPGRRARPAPVISKPAAKAALEELGSPPPRGRRVTFDIKSSAPTSTEDGDEDEKEDMQSQVAKEIEPAVGVGRRGARGRARPEPNVPAPAVEVAAEEDAAPIPRGRRGKGKAPEPIKLDGREAEGKEEQKLEEKEEDVPDHGVARPGPSRRTRPVTLEARATRGKDPAISTEAQYVHVEEVPVRSTRARKPTMKAAVADERKMPRGTTKKAAATNSTLQNNKEEQREAVGAVASDGACYDLENVKETADSQNLKQIEVIHEPKHQEKDVLTNEDELLEAILVWPTRARKPTMKAELMAEEKGQRRITKRSSTLQKEKQQDEPQEAVPAPVSDEACCDQENVEQVAYPQNVEQTNVVDEPNQEDKEAVPAPVSDEACCDLKNVVEAADPQNLEHHEMIDESKQEEEEAVPAPVSDEACFDLENVEEAAHPQNLEKSEMINLSKQEEKGIVMNEDETLVLDETSVEKSSVTDEILMEENLTEQPPEIDEGCMGISAVEKDECKVKSPVEEEQVNVKPCGSLLPSLEYSPILGLASMFGEQFENDEDKAVWFQGKEKSPVDEQQVDVKPYGSLLPSLEDSPILGLASMFAEQFENDEDKAVSFQGKEKSPVTEQQVDVKPCGSLLPSLEDSPILGLASMFAEQFENDEDKAIWLKGKEKSPVVEQQVDVKPCGSLLPSLENSPIFGLASMFAEHIENDEENHHSGEGMEMAPLIQALQTPLTADKPVPDVKPRGSLLPSLEDSPILGLVSMFAEQFENEDKVVQFHGEDEEGHHAGEEMEMTPLIPAKDGFTCQADDGSKMDSSNSVQQTEGITTVNADDRLVSQEKGDVTDDEAEEQPNMVDESAVQDTVVSETVQNEGVISDGESVVVEKAELVTEELPHGSTKLDENAEEHQTELVTEVLPHGTAKQKLVVDGEKSELVTDKLPHGSAKLDENGEEHDLQNGSAKQMSVVIGEKTELVTDKLAHEESAITGDLPRVLDITSALLDDNTETLSKITITEPTGSRNENVPMCKNSTESAAEPVFKNCSEKNTDEPVCKNKSENKTAEPVAMQENMGGKVAKKSADLEQLSLCQLRTKLKKTLQRQQNEQNKRVALGSVDGNVCRSNKTGQEQAGKLQQYQPGEEASSKI